MAKIKRTNINAGEYVEQQEFSFTVGTVENGIAALEKSGRLLQN